MFIVPLAAGLLMSMSADSPPEPPTRLASICFGKGEQESGMNKICYYECLSGTVAITVGSLEFCPLSIDHE